MNKHIRKQMTDCTKKWHKQRYKSKNKNRCKTMKERQVGMKKEMNGENTERKEGKWNNHSPLTFH